MPVIKSWETGGRSPTAAREHIARLNASLADQAAIISGLNSKVNHHQEVARLAAENSRLCNDMLKKSADREGVLTKQVDDQRETGAQGRGRARDHGDAPSGATRLSPAPRAVRVWPRHGIGDHPGRRPVPRAPPADSHALGNVVMD